VDTARELSGFGEVVDPRRRAELLDEGVEVLDALLRGERVEHRGAHFVADGVTYEPRPVQRPRPPFWFAARQGARRPVRRAARYEGLFPIEVDADQLADDLELVAEQRGSLDGFDVAVLTHAGLALEPFVAAGATWAMHAIAPGTTVDDVLARVAEAERPGR
jgi:alkanesulfonate monooxygenase SsuD/methylene tetrahydromethanopterin reductase-like flavin-dependent oxidoreductase (luciferase family)